MRVGKRGDRGYLRRCSGCCVLRPEVSTIRSRIFSLLPPKLSSTSLDHHGCVVSLSRSAVRRRTQIGRIGVG